MINNRSELLFIYDVKDANPNGDPADENKPRIDEETGVNIVTDVRLKRTIRDYFLNFKGYNGDSDKDIFVRQKPSEKSGKGLQDGKERATNFGKTKQEMLSNILKQCIDIRMFGGVLPLEKDSITYTGPIQFKMGRSLHQVEITHIKGTGAFASKAGAEQNTFREEYILPYSLIAFYGVINENAAKETLLSHEDVELLKEAIWEGTKNLISRSKFEHTPRLLLVVNYNQPCFFIGELDKYISLKKEIPDEKLRDITELKIDLSKIEEILLKNKDKIRNVEIKKDERTSIIGLEKTTLNIKEI